MSFRYTLSPLSDFEQANPPVARNASGISPESGKISRSGDRLMFSVTANFFVTYDTLLTDCLSPRIRGSRTFSSGWASGSRRHNRPIQPALSCLLMAENGLLAPKRPANYGIDPIVSGHSFSDYRATRHRWPQGSWRRAVVRTLPAMEVRSTRWARPR